MIFKMIPRTLATPMQAIDGFTWLLLAEAFALSALDGMIRPFTALVLEGTFGFGLIASGGVMGLTALTGPLMALPAGGLADRHGGPAIAATGLTICLLALGGLASASTGSGYAMGLLGFSMGRIVFLCGFVAHCSLLARDEEGALRLFRLFAVNAGFALGPFLTVSVGGARADGQLLAGLGVLAACAIAMIPGTLVRARAGEADPEGAPEFVRPAVECRNQGLRVGLRPRFMKIYLSAMIVSSMAHSQHLSTLSQDISMRPEPSLSIGAFDVMLAWKGVSSLLLYPLFYLAARRFGTRLSLPFGHAVIAAAFLMLAVSLEFGSMAGLASAAVTLAIGEVVSLIAAPALPIAASTASTRARFMAVASLGLIGAAIGPWVGSFLLASAGPGPWLWVGTAVCALLAGGLHAWAQKLFASGERGQRCPFREDSFIPFPRRPSHSPLRFENVFLSVGPRFDIRAAASSCSRLHN